MQETDGIKREARRGEEESKGRREGCVGYQRQEKAEKRRDIYTLFKTAACLISCEQNCSISVTKTSYSQ